MDHPTSPQRLTLTRDRNYAAIRLNRAAQLNSLSRATLHELSALLSRLHRDSRLRAIIVTGSENVFSVGADLNEVAQLDAATAEEFSRLGQQIFSQLRNSSLLTIAAIDGHCIGGGLDLALSCARRVATPRATFQHPGARRGIITGWSGTALLPRLVGRGPALRLLLTAERVSATQALAVGLIDEVCEDAVARAVEVAQAAA